MLSQDNGPTPSIVYIAGYGRSGSTVLDILLGNHPSIFGAGELTTILWEWSHGGRCSCGQTCADCAFWQRVLQRVHSALPDLTPQRARQITRRVQSPLASLWPPAGSSARDRELYGRLWRAMLVAIGQESGKSIIVDSSKSSGAATGRVRALAALCGLDVKVLHLVRDPRAAMWSVMRGSNRRLEAGQKSSLWGATYKALIGWELTNLYIHLTQATARRLPSMRIRYEDLVGDPVRELNRLGTFLDVDLQPVLARVQNQETLDPGHGVSGNRLRRQGPVRLIADTEWKAALPASARLLAASSWPLAHKYGYDVLRNGGDSLAEAPIWRDEGAKKPLLR